MFKKLERIEGFKEANEYKNYINILGKEVDMISQCNISLIKFFRFRKFQNRNFKINKVKFKLLREYIFMK